ncbi:MAG: LamG domain-containing protein [Candidatus Lokiarchaeota archaeon]
MKGLFSSNESLKDVLDYSKGNNIIQFALNLVHIKDILKRYNVSQYEIEFCVEPLEEILSLFTSKQLSLISRAVILVNAYKSIIFHLSCSKILGFTFKDDLYKFSKNRLTFEERISQINLSRVRILLIKKLCLEILNKYDFKSSFHLFKIKRTLKRSGYKHKKGKGKRKLKTHNNDLIVNKEKLKKRIFMGFFLPLLFILTVIPGFFTSVYFHVSLPAILSFLSICQGVIYVASLGYGIIKLKDKNRRVIPILILGGLIPIFLLFYKSFIFSLLTSLISILIIELPENISLSIKQPRKSLYLLYHTAKLRILFILLLISVGFFGFCFIWAPDYLGLPTMIILIVIVIFTVKCKYYKQKKINERKYEYSNTLKRRFGIKRKGFKKYDPSNVRHPRATILMCFFLVCLPLVFGVNSLGTVTTPPLEFARVPSDLRISGGNFYGDLNFEEDFDFSQMFTINDEIVVRCFSDPIFGQSGVIHVRINPINVTEVEGRDIEDDYDLFSEYSRFGFSRKLFVKIKFNELKLNPGKYEFKISYGLLSGFGYRESQPNTYNLELGKDNLKILSADPFEIESKYGYEAGFITTMATEEYWNVTFAGQVINSIGQGVQLDKLDLYLQRGVTYGDPIATINTDKFGYFHYEHIIYGSIRMNMLGAAGHVETALYNELFQDEYIGLEDPINGNRFFIDEDGDNYPDNLPTIDEFLDSLRNSIAPVFQFEVGRTIIYGTIDYGYSSLIMFENEYQDPVVISHIETREGDESVEVRVKDVNSTSCVLFMQERDGDNHTPENVSYIIMEKGNWELSPDNIKIEANSVFTDSVHTDSDAYEGVTVDFTQNFTSTPVVLFSLNNYYNNEYKHSILYNSSATSFTIQQANGFEPIPTVGERISYIAIEAGKSGIFENHIWETGLANDGTKDGVDDTPHSITYVKSYSKKPLIFVDQQTQSEPESSLARGAGYHSTTQYQVYAEETQNRNDVGSRDHSDEIFGWLIFDEPFSYYYTPPLPDLAFHAQFNESSGSVTHDSAENYMGLLMGNTTWTDGVIGSGLYFSESNEDYINYSSIAGNIFETNAEFTITGFINPSSFSSSKSVNNVTNLFFSSGNIELGIYNSRLHVYIDGENNQVTAVYGDKSIDVNKYSFFALRFDQGEVNVFLGDKWFNSSIGDVSQPWIDSMFINLGDNLTLGGDRFNISSFNGKIDEFRIYRKALSNFDIELLKYDQITIANVSILKDSEEEGWVPISQGESLEDYILFNSEVELNPRTPIDKVEFYLSDTNPNMTSPNERLWTKIKEFDIEQASYNYVMNSRDIPDSNWYFIAKVIGNTGGSFENIAYSAYSINNATGYFEIDHFHDSLDILYLDLQGRINHNSEISIDAIQDFGGQINSIDLYVNYSDNIDYLNSFSSSYLSSHYNIIPLNSLLDWKVQNGLEDGEFNASFIIDANFTFSPFKKFYYYNYSLDPIIIDFNSPVIYLEQIEFPKVFNDPSDYYLNLLINSTLDDIDTIRLDFKYDTPEATWITFETYTIQELPKLIQFNIKNLRDSKVHFRLISYDRFGNSFILTNDSYYFIKNFNEGEFIINGFDAPYYTVNKNGLIDLNVSIKPYDNDISSIRVSTPYESFILSYRECLGNNYIFEDSYQNNDDIALTPIFYSIYGTDFVDIPITIRYYQNQTVVGVDQVIITATYSAYKDVIQINDLSWIDYAAIDNVYLSFATSYDSYNNSQGIPFIVDNSYPYLGIWDSKNRLVDTIVFHENYDSTYNELYPNIEIQENYFVIPRPILLPNDICSVQNVYVNGTSYEFSYLIDSSNILITLDSNEYLDSISDIEIDYLTTSSLRTNSQYVGSYNFTTLPQGYYKLKAYFKDISGTISTYAINNYLFDYDGPQITKLFGNTEEQIDKCINPENGTIEFEIYDPSTIKDWNLNVSILGYWEVIDTSYIFHFNDSSLIDGNYTYKLTCVDMLNQSSFTTFTLYIDNLEPEFTEITNEEFTFSGLYSIIVNINEASGYYTLDLRLERDATGTIYTDFDYSKKQIDVDRWQFLIDVTQFPPGNYSVFVICTDQAGNSREAYKLDRYFDAIPPVLNEITHTVYFEGTEEVFEITEGLYFNGNDNISLTAEDITYDGFDWGDIEALLGHKKGVYNVSMRYTNPLSYQKLLLDTPLSFDDYLYKIIGFGDPVIFDTSLIKEMQQIFINGKKVEFELITQGGALFVKIDEDYRYLLNPSYSNFIYAEFYELNPQKIPLTFDLGTHKWILDQFNISEYNNAIDQDKFLFWFELEDGNGYATHYLRMPNVLISEKFEGSYDPHIDKSEGTLYRWNLGKDASNNGILCLGTEDLSDCTLLLNTSITNRTRLGTMDIKEIIAYGSEIQANWQEIGKFTFLGYDKWALVVTPSMLDQISSINYIRVTLFDYGHNYISEIAPIAIYDYSNIKLLTNILYEQIFEYDPSEPQNLQVIDGQITNYFDNEQFWSIIAEYYDSARYRWIDLYTNPALITTTEYAGTRYEITWDMNQDIDFLKNMQNTSTSYLPFLVTPETDQNLYGSWGMFSRGIYQPIIISREQENLHLSIFNYSFISGWTNDFDLSKLEDPITSIEGQRFKLFDTNNDGFQEIIRILPNRIDILYFNTTTYSWKLKSNVTNIQNTEILAFDANKIDGNSIAVSASVSVDENIILAKYQFGTNFNLIKQAETTLDYNILPTSIKIVENFTYFNKKAILLGGFINQSYYSKLLLLDYNFKLEHIIEESILGKISVIEFLRNDNYDKVSVGLDLSIIGERDRVIVYEHNVNTGEWEKYELSGFDTGRLHILDLLAINENSEEKLVIASTKGIFEYTLIHNTDIFDFSKPLLPAYEIFSKSNLTSNTPTITLKYTPVDRIEKVMYKTSLGWFELSKDKYDFSRWEIILDLSSIYSQLTHIKIVYAYESYTQSEKTYLDTEFNKYSGTTNTTSFSAFNKYFANTNFSLQWENPNSENWMVIPHNIPYQFTPIASRYKGSKGITSVATLSNQLIAKDYLKFNLSNIPYFGDLVGIKGLKEDYDDIIYDYPLTKFEVTEDQLILDPMYKGLFKYINIEYVPQIYLEYRDNYWYIPNSITLGNTQFSDPLFITNVRDDAEIFGTFSHPDIKVNYTLGTDAIGDLFLNFTQPTQLVGIPAGAVFYSSFNGSQVGIPSIQDNFIYGYNIIDSDSDFITGSFRIDFTSGFDRSRFSESRFSITSYKAIADIFSYNSYTDEKISIGTFISDINQDNLGFKEHILSFNIEDISYSGEKDVCLELLRKTMLKGDDTDLLVEFRTEIDSKLNGHEFIACYSQEIKDFSFTPRFNISESQWNGEQVEKKLMKQPMKL